MQCDFSSSGSWIILSPIEQSIKQKIEAAGKPLKEWGVSIYRGVLTGYNEAFIITSEKRMEILKNCKTEDERTRTDALIRPILRGRDIKRYGYDWAGLWLIATFPARHYDIDDFPAVRKYLLTFGKERLEQTGATHIINGEKAKSRKKTTNKWFETQDSISYWEDFYKPKIVYGQFQNNAEYSFAEPGVFASSNEYIMIVNDYSPKCLLAFLNSNALEWLLSKITGNLGGNAKIGQKSNFIKLPIPMLSEKQQFLYDCLVDKVLSNMTDHCLVEEEINNKVFEYFGLTLEEKDFILKSLSKT